MGRKKGRSFALLPFLFFHVLTVFIPTHAMRPHEWGTRSSVVVQANAGIPRSLRSLGMTLKLWLERLAEVNTAVDDLEAKRLVCL
jgi:hypothetical protein